MKNDRDSRTEILMQSNDRPSNDAKYYWDVLLTLFGVLLICVFFGYFLNLTSINICTYAQMPAIFYAWPPNITFADIANIKNSQAICWVVAMRSLLGTILFVWLPVILVWRVKERNGFWDKSGLIGAIILCLLFLFGSAIPAAERGRFFLIGFDQSAVFSVARSYLLIIGFFITLHYLMYLLISRFRMRIR